VAEFRVYFDTGVLVKLYYLEPGSPQVAARATQEPFLPFPSLAEIELRNALRVLHGRKLLEADELVSALALIDEDTRAGRLRRLSPDPLAVHECAEDLSRRHAARTKCRALDLLHVSHAVVCGIPRLFTGDRRQAELAECAGLQVELLNTSA
jgi:predicted nucleic acid-binding protein